MIAQYDVIVVGAGPAGAIAAKKAAEAGVSVLLIDQKEKIGVPSHCAGGILTLILDQMGLFSVVKKSIRAEIHAFKVYSPHLKSASYRFQRKIGYVVDRPSFDQLLCSFAQKNGVEVLPNTRAIGVKRRYDGNELIIRRRDEKSIQTIHTKVLIGADGIASTIARSIGLNIPRKYIGIGYSYNAANLTKISPDTVEIYFLPALLAGYAWIFPHGKGRANIGLGGYQNGRFLKKLFKLFQEKHPISAPKLGNAQLLNYTGGIIPGSRLPSRTTFNYGMLVGDAANQVNPLSGEGIRLALKCGSLAGQLAAYAIKSGKLPYIHHYHKLWHKMVGLELTASYLLRHFLFRFTANDLDLLVEAISRSNLNLLSKKNRWILLFLQTFLSSPSLIRPFRKIGRALPLTIKLQAKSVA
ncbi:MAG: NAD(P)/FAD-dependent oxidoreductase [Candidatus Helarchaeota archaeon]